MSLQETDRQSAAVAVAPRVALSDIEAAIAHTHYAVGSEAFDVSSGGPLGTLTLCALTMRNGFTVIGKSAPASPENFNVELGRRFAYEDAVRQLWPLMGFAPRERIASGQTG
jgi:hypothetical protein